jgi:Ran GTPase-activating protein (RanGAP) involved in mRNA processing and transport
MALSQNANLSVLKLGYNNLGDEGVTTLAAGIAVHKSLVSLDLGFNNFGDEGCKSLAVAMQKACQANHGGTIRTLYLAGNLIGEDGAIALADCIRQGSCLRKLYLTGNRLGTDGVKAITEAILEDELRRSDNTNNSMDDERLVDVENPANDENDESNDKPPADNSSFLGMQELFFGGTGMGSSGASSVARLLERSSCLRVISLPNCNIGDEEVSMLASGIRPNREKLPLESIQLSFNNMTYKGLEALINAVWGSSTLRELRLDNNEIGDRGAHQVAAILPVIKTLEVLDVGFNSIKVAGLNTLMKAVAETQYLKSLSVSGNAIDVAAAKAVAYALAYNRSLQSLYLVHCTIGHEGQRHISAGVVSNCNTALRKLTGFDLGRELAERDFHCVVITRSLPLICLQSFSILCV